MGVALVSSRPSEGRLQAFSYQLSAISYQLLPAMAGAQAASHLGLDPEMGTRSPFSAIPGSDCIWLKADG